jgi:hypothetical protein
MNKKHIIEEIKRTAKANNNVPLGMHRFQKETGIKRHEWCGKFWRNWGEALIEAGYEPNTMQPAYDDIWVIKQLISLIKEIGKFPTDAEIKLKHRKDGNFPSSGTIDARLGNKKNKIKKILDFCQSKKTYEDIIAICRATPIPKTKQKNIEKSSTASGHVYLLKHDNAYKIGKSFDVTRHYKEIRVQMPHDTEEIHVIETDDPSGIEAYWHNRFKDKKLKGEWFNLSPDDIKAFRKRKFM